MKKYENYVRAHDAFTDEPAQDLTNEYVQSGVINKFSLQFELSWKLLKALLAYEGDMIASSGSPRDIIRAAYRYYNFIDEDVWLSMLRDRNQISHIYDSNKALELIDAIINRYLPEFINLKANLDERYGDLLTKPDSEL